MPNQYFRFKKFTILQDKTAMKVTTDACLFGAWVAKQISQTRERNPSLLDIGTGTGLLALMIAQENPALPIDAIEIDKEAYGQALENINAAGLPHRITIIEGDVLHIKAKHGYDFIVCNPPFYENELRSPDAGRNKAHHDASLLMRDLIPVMRSVLLPSGQFFLLSPYKRMAEVEELFHTNGLSSMRKLLVRQSENHDYFRVCYHGTLSHQVPCETTELSIRNTAGDYTPGFISLLTDYYLYL